MMLKWCPYGHHFNTQMPSRWTKFEHSKGVLQDAFAFCPVASEQSNPLFFRLFRGFSTRLGCACCLRGSPPVFSVRLLFARFAAGFLSALWLRGRFRLAVYSVSFVFTRSFMYFSVSSRFLVPAKYAETSSRIIPFTASFFDQTAVQFSNRSRNNASSSFVKIIG